MYSTFEAKMKIMQQGERKEKNSSALYEQQVYLKIQDRHIIY